jgi:hypothetical protein
MNELVKNLIEECKRDQELERLYKATHIEFDNYFKYSGEVEPYQALISCYTYNDNNFKSGNQLHEQFIKTQEYEKLWENNKGNSGRFSKAIEAYYWDEAKNNL